MSSGETSSGGHRPMTASLVQVRCDSQRYSDFLTLMRSEQGSHGCRRDWLMAFSGRYMSWVFLGTPCLLVVVGLVTRSIRAMQALETAPDLDSLGMFRGSYLGQRLRAPP